MAGGTVSLDALEIYRRGVRNVLAYRGVLPPERAAPRRGDGHIFELPAPDAYVFATVDGLF
jgi:N-alpha-acetyl-L-2,4-diaminobutyrate deacetylase